MLQKDSVNEEKSIGNFFLIHLRNSLQEYFPDIPAVSTGPAA